MSAMRISPLDIRRQQFKTSMRGADKEEVRIFLEMVASDFEKALQENAMMAETIRHQNERLEEYRRLEQSMHNSLITAERIASESRETSEREAARVVQDAHARGERILADARERLQQLMAEIEDIRGKREVFVRRFRTLLESQAAMLEEHGPEGLDTQNLRRTLDRLAARDDSEPAPARTETPANPRPAEAAMPPRENGSRAMSMAREVHAANEASAAREAANGRMHPSAQQLSLPAAPTRETPDMSTVLSREWAAPRNEDTRPRLPVRRSESPTEAAPARAADAVEPQPARGLGRFFRRSDGVLPLRGARVDAPERQSDLYGRREGVFEISASETAREGSDEGGRSA